MNGMALILLMALTPAAGKRGKAPARPGAAKAAAPAAPPSLPPQEVTAAADVVRNPQKPFRMNNTLVEYVSGTAGERVMLTIFAKEEPDKQYRTLAMYREPPRDDGKVALFNAAKLWFYDPASKASVRLSPQQRLVGQASVGDVLAVNLAHDYKAELVGTETLEDSDHVSHDCYHLNLTPATPDAIYGRIEYWVERGTNHPVKGKFYTDSTRLLKVAYYHRYENQLGNERPMETIIIDGVDTKRVTTVTISDYRFQDIPDAWFQKDYLPRVKAD